LRAQLDQLQVHTIPSLESNIKGLTGQMTQCHNVIGNFKSENTTLKEQLSVIEGKYSQSTDELVTAIEKANQLGQYKAMYEELLSSAKDKQIDVVTPAVIATDNSVLRETYTVQINELQEEINRLKDENSKLTQSIQQKTRELTASMQVKDELEALLTRRDASIASSGTSIENTKTAELKKEIEVLTEAIAVLQKQKLTKSTSSSSAVSDKNIERGMVKDDATYESLASVVNVLNQSKTHWQKLATSTLTQSLLPLSVASADTTIFEDVIHTERVYYDVRNVRARIKVVDLSSENINTMIQRNNHNEKGNFLLILLLFLS